jgi:hypothetical protein
MSSNDLVKQSDSFPESISLTDGTNLSLKGLNEEQKQALVMKYAGSMLDLQKKATENSIDAQGIRNQIDSHIDQSNKATQDGNSATISYTHDSSLGRTEALIGNTDRAAGGKLSKSATGGKDNTIMIITIIAVAAVLIAIFASG